MLLKSMSFKNDAFIPALYSCEGKDQSPHLGWRHLPEKTKSLALIVEDPDAPQGKFVHWVAWNLDPRAKGLKANVDNQAPESLLIQGQNSAGKGGYLGPCPAIGAHRYFFRLYALDTTLALPKSTTKEGLLDAMKGHVLDSAELVGKYQKGISQ